MTFELTTTGVETQSTTSYAAEMSKFIPNFTNIYSNTYHGINKILALMSLQNVSKSLNNKDFCALTT